MKSISFKEDWHGVKSTAQDIDIWTFLVTSSGVSVLGRAKLFLKGNVGWFFITIFYVEERSCWLLKPSTAVLSGHPQLHCAQAVVLCRNWMHRWLYSPGLEAVMFLWTVKGFLC